MKQRGMLSRTNDETKRRVIMLYQRGHSQLYIEDALSMTRKTIRRILEDNNIKRTSLEQTIYHHLESTLREDAFDVVDDDVAYWLGFMYADGYITNPNTHTSFGILLKESDVGHLEKFKDFLKAPNKIYHRQDGEYGNVKIYIGSQRLHAQLMRWGFTTNKSYDASPPEVFKYNRHFWRGVVDGDGYLGVVNGMWRIHLCGTPSMVEGFRTFLIYSGVDTDAQVAKTKGKELYTFCLAGNESCV